MIAHNKQPDPEDESEIPAPATGLGGVCPSDNYPVIGREARLLARAAKWNVKPEYREAILKRQLKDAINPGSTPRDANRAAKFVLEADKLDTTIEMSDKGQPQGTTINIQNNGGPGVQVNYDGNWYGNENRLATETS